ncbi:MAG: hypothetical protein QOK42_1395 [Frankiaceae bacterium]|jgi:hypothetical protein|nr:hypothetical protein [Frankiaceae bacterium]
MLRAVIAAATLLGGASALEANATAPAPVVLTGTTTVTGPAGGTLSVKLTRTGVLRFDKQAQRALSASKGGFAGVGLTSRDGMRWMTYSGGLPASSCAFATSCQQYDFMDLSGSDAGPSGYAYQLRAGTYTLGLLGAPGSTVTARLAWEGLPAGAVVLHTTGHGSLRVAAPASTLPSVPGAQVEWSGASSLPGAAGPTFAGAVLRYDLQTAKDVSYDVCISQGDNAAPAVALPSASVCSGSTTGGGGGGVYTYDCGTVPLTCIPADAGAFALSVTLNAMNTSAPAFSVSAEARAVKTRIGVTIYALTVVPS